MGKIQKLKTNDMAFSLVSMGKGFFILCQMWGTCDNHFNENRGTILT